MRARWRNGRKSSILGPIPDGLYERDVLAWSQHQAELLLRLQRGERVNGVNWTNLAEEIGAVGRSELHLVETFLTLMMLRLLKLHAWPDSAACNHWRGEIIGFQTDANRAFAPSMRQKIDIGGLHADALKAIAGRGTEHRLFRREPFSLDDLLTEQLDVLLTRLPPAA